MFVIRVAWSGFMAARFCCTLLITSYFGYECLRLPNILESRVAHSSGSAKSALLIKLTELTFFCNLSIILLKRSLTANGLGSGLARFLSSFTFITRLFVWLWPLRAEDGARMQHHNSRRDYLTWRIKLLCRRHRERAFRGSLHFQAIYETSCRCCYDSIRCWLLARHLARRDWIKLLSRRHITSRHLLQLGPGISRFWREKECFSSLQCRLLG